MAEQYPRRKRIRLPEFDYGANYRYFVTICTQDRAKILSKITVGEGLAPPKINLSVYGELVREELFQLQDRFSSVSIDKYVIMPNHIHIILRLEDTGGASPSPTKESTTLYDAICAFKSLSVRRCKKMGFVGKLWQRGYHDHVIRNEEDYRSIWEYIDNNPARWTEDEYYTES